MNPRAKFFSNLKKNSDLTLKDIFGRAGITVGFLSRGFRGEKHIPDDTFIRILWKGFKWPKNKALYALAEVKRDEAFAGYLRMSLDTWPSDVKNFFKDKIFNEYKIHIQIAKCKVQQAVSPKPWRLDVESVEYIDKLFILFSIKRKWHFIFIDIDNVEFSVDDAGANKYLKVDEFSDLLVIQLDTDLKEFFHLISFEIEQRLANLVIFNAKARFFDFAQVNLKQQEVLYKRAIIVLNDFYEKMIMPKNK